MIIYRIALTKFSDTSGEGARLYGGRWNLPGRAALYGSSSISSALLERLTIDSELFSSERYVLYSTMEIHCPEHFIYFPEISKLPAGWDTLPYGSAPQKFGAELLQKGIWCFGVPSVVDRSSLNYVIDPLDKRFSELHVKTYPLQLDHRIVRS